VLGRVVTETVPGETAGAKTEYLAPGTDTGVTPNVSSRAGTRLTNDKGQVTSQYADAFGRLVDSIDAAGVATRFAHDAHGNVTSVTVDANSATTITNTFDILNRKLTMNDPDMGDWEYAHNSFGELRRQEDANGNITVLAYDNLGRTLTRTENGTDVTELEYDTADYGVGQVASVTGPEGDVKDYAYDAYGRPVETTTTLPGVSGTFVTRQDFDPEGRVDLVTYPATPEYSSGLEVRYSFNDFGYLEEVRHAQERIPDFPRRPARFHSGRQARRPRRPRPRLSDDPGR
jgi:YD repeat-containing protein